MFVYEKKLQYPVRIKNTNPAFAKFIITQYGGPDGELGASLRYLSQRYAMPYPELKGLLTDIGTEELGHLEMIGAIVHQLTRSMSIDEIKKAGFDAYFVDHTAVGRRIHGREGRRDHRPFRGHGGRAEGAHDL